MIEYFRRRLGAKLLLSYLAVIVAGMIVLVIASQSILPASFNRHMGGTMGSGMGMGIRSGTGPMAQLYDDFRAGFNDVLTYAALASVLAAIVLSLVFSRSMVASLHAVSRAAQRISDGAYGERVQVSGSDELAQLASRFNQMAEKLSRTESMRRRLIGDVSHELRTPLTAIKGSMEGLMDGILPSTHETYAQIHAEAERLNHLVDDLQELSRVEAGAYELDIRPVEMASLLRRVTQRLAPFSERKHIRLEFELAPRLPRLLADQDRLVQVLMNLVANALQYTPEGGQVTISAQQIGGEVQVSVRDTGIGIPPEHLARLFDRFYRVDKSRSRQSGGGSGIGLTIVRALVEAHGGHIRAESAGEGQGSTFTFTLPIEESRSPAMDRG